MRCRINPAIATPARTLRRIEDLPGPRPWPLVGNALQFKASQFHQQLEQWCRDYGPYYKIHLGPRPLLVVGEHEAVASALRDRPDGFRRTARLEAISREIGLKPGLFGAEGDMWRHQRRMVMASFDPAHVKHYFPSLTRVAGRLAKRWQAAAEGGHAIDLQADLMRYTIDTIAGLAFGAEVNTLESDHEVIQRHLDKIFPALLRRLLAPLPYWRWVKLPADRALARSIVEVDAAVQGFIAQARERLRAAPARRVHPHDLLEAMLAAADEPGSGIDDGQVAGNVLTMLLAGEDTTANTIAWMIDLLWRHPAELQRATDEVRRVCGDARELTLDQMAQLDFVEACAHETMRLKPVAPQLGLQTLRDTIVGDVLVPKDTAMIGLLRRDSVDERHLARATTFEPARWLAEGGPSAMATSPKRLSMPFGAGPRMCPGRYLALLEMKMAMATLLGRFDTARVDTPDGQPAPERLSFTMAPVGLRMRLRQRA
ncbi:MAG: cytochrome P450 [Burkholderiales bacterium]